MYPSGHRPKIACLLVTDLPVKAERSRYPALRRRPLVIVEPGIGGDTVLDSSVEAEGVVRGMTLSEALQMCGNATVMQADHRHYDKVDDQIARALGRRCGHVERDGLGGMYVTLHAAVAPYGEAHLVATLSNAVPVGFGPRVGSRPGEAHLVRTGPGHSPTEVHCEPLSTRRPF